ncbi:MAG: glycosyltransferase family 39 protein [bacterium]|nr:glycosyltransferase family 39 protein [bacterium]
MTVHNSRLQPHPSSQPAALWWLLAALILLAFALRIYRLDAVALRGDEAFTAVHWTKTPFSPDWLFMAQYEPNPGAQVAYWAWSGLVGTSEFALRMLPLLGNVFGLAVMVALVRRLKLGWYMALWCAALWAVNPFFIWHAQDARQYALITALTPLNFYLLLRAVDKGGRHWVLYGFVQTITVYVYYIELFWVAAQGVYLLLRHRDRLWHFFITWCGIGLLLIPLAAQVYYVLFVNGYSGTAARADFGQLFSVFLPGLLLGEQATLPVVGGMVLFALLLIGVWRLREQRVLLLAWLLVPMVLFFIASTQTSLFRPRYVIATTPVLLLALVGTLANFPRTWRASVNVVMVFLCVLSLVAVYGYYVVDPPKAPDWRGLTRYLRERTTSRSVIVSDSADTALEYYNPGTGEIYFIPFGYVPSEQDALDLLRQHDAIYVLSGSRTGDLAQYLQSKAQHIPGDTLPGINQYRPWSVRLSEIDVPLYVPMGNIARLRGYTLLGDNTLLLYWEAVGKTPTDYSVLLHLEDQRMSGEGIPPAAVLDHGIAGAVVSTRTWTPGTIYRDPVALPQNLPPGQYRILVGMYESISGRTLPVGPEAAGEDRLFLGRVTLR